MPTPTLSQLDDLGNRLIALDQRLIRLRTLLAVLAAGSTGGEDAIPLTPGQMNGLAGRIDTLMMNCESIVANLSRFTAVTFVAPKEVPGLSQAKATEAGAYLDLLNQERPDHPNFRQLAQRVTQEVKRSDLPRDIDGTLATTAIAPAQLMEVSKIVQDWLGDCWAAFQRIRGPA